MEEVLFEVSVRLVTLLRCACCVSTPMKSSEASALRPALTSCFLRFQENVDGGEAVNGVSEPSPTGSPGAARKGKASQAATLPAKTQQDTPTSQLEGFLHRKHEWEGHNKKASSR